MNLYDAATEAVYGRMGASSDMPYENHTQRPLLTPTDGCVVAWEAMNDA